MCPARVVPWGRGDSDSGGGLQGHERRGQGTELGKLRHGEQRAPGGVWGHMWGLQGSVGTCATSPQLPVYGGTRGAVPACCARVCGHVCDPVPSLCVWGHTRVPPGMLWVPGGRWGQGQARGCGTHSRSPPIPPCFGASASPAPSQRGWGHPWPWDSVSPAPQGTLPPPAPIPGPWRDPAGGSGVPEPRGCSASPCLGDLGVKGTQRGT